MVIKEVVDFFDKHEFRNRFVEKGPLEFDSVLACLVCDTTIRFRRLFIKGGICN